MQEREAHAAVFAWLKDVVDAAKAWHTIAGDPPACADVELTRATIGSLEQWRVLVQLYFREGDDIETAAGRAVGFVRERAAQMPMVNGLQLRWRGIGSPSRPDPDLDPEGYVWGVSLSLDAIAV